MRGKKPTHHGTSSGLAERPSRISPNQWTLSFEEPLRVSNAFFRRGNPLRTHCGKGWESLVRSWNLAHWARDIDSGRDLRNRQFREIVAFSQPPTAQARLVTSGASRPDMFWPYQSPTGSNHGYPENYQWKASIGTDVRQRLDQERRRRRGVDWVVQPRDHGREWDVKGDVPTSEIEIS